MIPLYDEEHTHGRSGARVTALILLLNICVFVMQIMLPSHLLNYELVTEHVWTQWWTLITNAFMHGGFLHILGNMWYLWIFGDNVEDHMGSWNFLFFYLACATLSSLGECLVYPHELRPFLGASGAISGVMAAYFALFPSAKVRCHIWGLYFTWVPAWMLIGGWFALQVISQSFDSRMSEGVSFTGHIFGFVAGIVLTRILFDKAEQYEP